MEKGGDRIKNIRIESNSESGDKVRIDYDIMLILKSVHSLTEKLENVVSGTGESWWPDSFDEDIDIYLEDDEDELCESLLHLDEIEEKDVIGAFVYLEDMKDFLGSVLDMTADNVTMSLDSFATEEIDEFIEILEGYKDLETQIETWKSKSGGLIVNEKEI